MALSGAHSHGHNHQSHDDDEHQRNHNQPLLVHADADVQRQDHVMRRLQLATALCVTFLVVEAVGGWWAGSLAILSDAPHLLADLAAFLVAMGAAHLASLPSTEVHTFGLKRMESLAALFSMASLALVLVGLAVEAVRRLIHPPTEPIDAKLMSGIAAIGVVVNGRRVGGTPCPHASHARNARLSNQASDVVSYGAVVHSDELDPNKISGRSHTESSGEHRLQAHDSSSTENREERNVNLHAAYLHVLGDLAQSAAVLIAGLVIWVQPMWHVVDPICTLGFCALVFYSTLGVLRSSIAVLLQEVLPNLSWQAIHRQIHAVLGVWNVHELHIWSISQGVPSLSVHVMVHGDESTPHDALANVHAVCQRHGIHHATIQVQCQGDVCITCSTSEAIIHNTTLCVP